MTGLETILSQIKQDAQAEADRVLTQAQNEADTIIKQAREEAEESLQRAKQKAEAEAVEADKRAHSAAQLAAKQSILQEKQALIGQVLELAKKEVENLPEEEYFHLLYQMVQQYAQEGPGQISLSSYDLQRLPKKFVHDLKKVQPELAVVEQPAAVGSGFILTYGGIEINCGFDALFAAAEEDMRDRAHEILFE